MHIDHSKKIILVEILGGVAVFLAIGVIALSSVTAVRILAAAILFIAPYLSITAARGLESEKSVKDLGDHLRETEWKLVISNEQIQVLDQRKSEFVSVVSHQLRAPVTAIGGYSSMLAEGTYGALPENMKDPVNKIFLSSKRVAELVTDFLDLTKIETGTLLYNFASVDVTAMLNELVAVYTPIAKERGLTFEANYAERKPCIATADGEKIKQIISNLLDNAVKYTTKGGIRVTLERDKPAGLLRVTIKDTGIGIPPDHMQNLFQKFSRGPTSPKLFTEGSGLGLYVAKKMLEQHKGGKIKAASDGEGKGSTFTLELLAEEN